jgi:hypothetical protein
MAPATKLGGGSAGTVTFTYLDPNAGSFPLKYSTLGMWTQDTTSISSTWSEVGGPFSAGVVTRGIDLPTTGGADYNGYMIGKYVTSDITSSALQPVGSYVVGANASAHVDFSGAGAVTLSTSNTYISKVVSGTLQAPIPESRLNLSTTSPMTINRTSMLNSFAGGSGTLTNGHGMGGASGGSDQVNGAFYGQPASTSPYAPPEMGGSLSIQNSTNSQHMVGSFGLIKQ